MSDPCTLTELLRVAAKRYRKRPAVSMNMNYRTVTLTYGELEVLAKRTSHWLKEQGIGAGDTVLVCSPNSPYVVALFFAVLLRGAIFVPLNVQSTKEMVRSVARSSGAKLLMSHVRATKDDELGLPTYTVDLLPLLVAQVEDGVHASPSITDQTIAQIMYTSGTTGDPKGVVLTHGNMCASVRAVTTHVRMSPRDRFLSILPLSHIYEQVVGLLAPLSSGAHVVYLHRPSALSELLAGHRVTKMVAVPEFLRILMARIEERAARTGTHGVLQLILTVNRFVPWMWLRRLIAWPVHSKLGGKLRTISSGGSPLDPELERMWGALGVTLLQGYGLTEVSAVATMNTARARKERTVGRPIPGVRVAIADDGEILIHGGTVFKGYHGNDDATHGAIDAHGWFHTGDIGSFDHDGFLSIKGRKKYMLKGQGGQNIYPEDIERELDREAGVLESCVVGIMHAEHLEIVGVVRAQGSVDARSIQERANTRLASYQAVNRVLVWPEYDFPKSASKKVKRDPVRAWVERVVGEGSAIVAPECVSKLSQLVANVIGIDASSVAATSTLAADLGLDSLMRVELVSRIELEFGVLIDEAKITSGTTLDDLQALVNAAAPTAPPEPFVRYPLTWWARVLRAGFLEPLMFLIAGLVSRVTVHGASRLDGIRGPVLLMPNHVSVFDSVVVAQALPYRMRRSLSHAAGADVDLFSKWKPLLWIVRLALNAFALPRTEGSQIAYGLSYVGWMLDNGYSVVIYPEGHVTLGETILPLKDGTAFLATQMGVPVVPVYINGMENVIVNHSLSFEGLRRPVSLTFGAPLVFQSTDTLERARLTLSLALRALRDEAKALDHSLWPKQLGTGPERGFRYLCNL